MGLACLLLLASLAASSFGMRLLLLGAQLKGVRTYDDLVLATLGRTGSQVRPGAESRNCSHPCLSPRGRA